MGLTVLVTGSRSWRNHDLVFERLDELLVRFRGDLFVVHGGAPGADRDADLWLVKRGRNDDAHRRVFKADWAAHPKAAGPVRNREMLKFLLERRASGDQLMGLAFRMAGKSNGTDDMTELMRGAGIEGRLIRATRR